MIAEADEVMALWCELREPFVFAYQPPRNDDLIARIYSYANWCLSAPRNDHPGRDPLTAVYVAFYEDIPTCQAAREDMPRWFRADDVARGRDVFSYHIGEESFEELLAYMRSHEYVHSHKTRIFKRPPKSS